MKVSELAQAADVTVATVKYYLREGLLHPGRLTSATQAEYDQTHVARLRLIRVLREVGDVPIASIGSVLDAIDNSRVTLSRAVETAHDALALHPAPGEVDPDLRRALAAHLRDRGWRVNDRSPALTAATEALAAVGQWWGEEVGPEVLEPYIEAAENLATFELDYIEVGQGKATTVEQVIVGTVVFERALVALRRLAEQHASDRRFGRR